MSRRRVALGLAALAAGAGWGVAAWLLWQTRVPGDLSVAHLRAGDYFAAAELRRTARYQRFLRIDWVLAQASLLGTLALYAVRGAGFARQVGCRAHRHRLLLGMIGFALAWLAQLPFGSVALWWQRRYGVSRLGYLEWIVQSWWGLGGMFLFLCLALLVVMGLARLLPRAWPVVGAPVFVGLALLVGFLQPYLLPSTDAVSSGPDRRGRPRARAEGESRPAARRDPERPRGDKRTERRGDGLRPQSAHRRVGHASGRPLHCARDSLRACARARHLAVTTSGKASASYALFALPGAALIALATRRRAEWYSQSSSAGRRLLALSALSLAAQPLQAVITRHIEAEADWLALQTTRDRPPGRSFFTRFDDRVEQPDPPLWDYLLLEVHPTLMQRIAMAEAWKAPVTRRPPPSRRRATCRARAPHQLLVCPLLDDLPVVEDDDQVGVADRREAVRDHERRAAGEERPQRASILARYRCRPTRSPRRG